jgi:hypothetical protein
MSFLGLVPLAKTLPIGTLSVLSILLSFLDVADAYCHSRSAAVIILKKDMDVTN